MTDLFQEDRALGNTIFSEVMSKDNREGKTLGIPPGWRSLANRLL